MNARQKAKRFKKLYEAGLPKTRPTIKLVREDLRKYVAIIEVSYENVETYPPKVLDHLIIDHLARDIADQVKNNMIVEDKPEERKKIASVNYWLEN